MDYTQSHVSSCIRGINCCKAFKVPGGQTANHDANDPYLNSMLKFVSELESAGHMVSELKKERGLLCGITEDFQIVLEGIIGGSFKCSETVPELIEHAFRMHQFDEGLEKAMMAPKKNLKCFNRTRNEHLTRKRRCVTNGKIENEKNKRKRGFVCNKKRRIGCGCLSKGKEDREPETTTSTVSKTMVSGTMAKRSEQRTPVSSCKRHVFN